MYANTNQSSPSSYGPDQGFQAGSYGPQYTQQPPTGYEAPKDYPPQKTYEPQNGHQPNNTNPEAQHLPRGMIITRPSYMHSNQQISDPSGNPLYYVRMHQYSRTQHMTLHAGSSDASPALASAGQHWTTPRIRIYLGDPKETPGMAEEGVRSDWKYKTHRFRIPVAGGAASAKKSQSSGREFSWSRAPDQSVGLTRFSKPGWKLVDTARPEVPLAVFDLNGWGLGKKQGQLSWAQQGAMSFEEEVGCLIAVLAIFQVTETVAVGAVARPFRVGLGRQAPIAGVFM